MPKPHEAPLVLLGIHADDHLDVYVRNGDQLHQAARLATTANVSADTMTTVMADLAVAFGWPKIAVTPTSEVSRASEQGLPRVAGDAAASSASRARNGRGRGAPGGVRRTRADMERQKMLVLEIVSAVPASDPLTVPKIASQVKRLLGIPGQSPETSVREHLLELYDEGKVGRVEYDRPNGHKGYDWHGLPPADSRISVESL
jgi:hypothetical protein